MHLRPMWHFSAAGLLALSLAAAAPLIVPAQRPAATAAGHDVSYSSTEMMVPMRDGVKLHIIVTRPRALSRTGHRSPS